MNDASHPPLIVTEQAGMIDDVTAYVPFFRQIVSSGVAEASAVCSEAASVARNVVGWDVEPRRNRPSTG